MPATRKSARTASTATAPPAELFAALSDATRLRLLNLLRAGETCVCDLVDGVDAPQPTVSRHLAVLRDTGLVTARKEGVWMHYSLATPTHALHRALLACLDECGAHETTFTADEKRVVRARRARGCCD
jgi:ArsR family transcriptional regulator